LIYVGVDPGLTGGVALLSGSYATVHDMPVLAYGNGTVKNALDCATLAGILRPYAASSKLCIERVSARPGQGVASMFSLGMSFYGVVGVAAGLGIPVTFVEPRRWKAHFGLLADKADALALARSFYPDAELHLKKHHGRAEALLIARYANEQGE